MAEFTTNTSNTIVGFFSSERNAESALETLHAAGFTSDQIGVACHSEPAISVKTPHAGFWHRTVALFGGGSNPQDTRTGAAQPLSTGQTANPETTGHFNLDAGDFHRTLTGLSLPDGYSRYFSDRFHSGKEGVLITVNAGSRRSDAEAILRRNSADMGEDMATRPASERTAMEPAMEARRMQLYGEMLRLHRDRVQRGDAIDDEQDRDRGSDQGRNAA